MQLASTRLTATGRFEVFSTPRSSVRQFQSSRFASCLIDTPARSCATLTGSLLDDRSIHIPISRLRPTPVDNSLPRDSHRSYSARFNTLDRSAPFSSQLVAAHLEPTPFDYSTPGWSHLLYSARLLNSSPYCSTRIDKSSLLRSPRANPMLLDWSSRLDSPPTGSTPRGSTTQKGATP